MKDQLLKALGNLPKTEEVPDCPRCKINKIHLALYGSATEGNICHECWLGDIYKEAAPEADEPKEGEA